MIAYRLRIMECTKTPTTNASIFISIKYIIKPTLFTADSYHVIKVRMVEVIAQECKMKNKSSLSAPVRKS